MMLKRRLPHPSSKSFMRTNGATWLTGLRVCLAVATLVLAARLVWSPITIQADFLSLLPASEALSPAGVRAYERQNQSIADRVVWVVSSPDKASALKSALAWAEVLGRHSSLMNMQQDYSTESINGLYEWLGGYQKQLLNAPAAAALKAAPDQFLNNKLAFLMSPTGSWAAMNVARDPLFLVGDYLQSNVMPDISVERGIPVLNHDGQWVAVVASSVKSGATTFGPEAPLLELRAKAKTFASEHGVNIAVSGVPLYAAYGMQSGYWEMTWIGAFSLLGIGLMIGCVFRSVWPLLYALTAIGAGAVWAMSVVNWVFGAVHVISLVFGAALIGISVDYAFHRLCEPESPRHVMKVTGVGMLTSALVFLGLTLVPVGLLNQVGVFAAVGLCVAWATAMLCVPKVTLAWRPQTQVPVLSKGEGLAKRVMASCGVVAICAVVVMNVPRADDIATFYAAPSDWIEDERMVQSVLNEWDRGFWVVTGSTVEEWRHREEQLLLSLADNTESVKALSDVVPSFALQRASWQAVKEALIETGSLRRWLVQLGVPDAVTNALESQPFEPLPLEPLVSKLDPTWQGLWLGCEPLCASIVRMKGGDVDSVTPPHGVMWVDVVPSVTALLGEVRESALAWLLFGLMVIGLVFMSRYGLLRGLTIVSTPVVGVMAALIALWWLGESITVFHACAFLLVVGIAVDYGLFMTLAKAPERSAMAVGLALVTSLLGFGLLALSETPVVQAFGQVVAPGLLASALWAMVWRPQNV